MLILLIARSSILQFHTRLTLMMHSLLSLSLHSFDSSWGGFFIFDGHYGLSWILSTLLMRFYLVLEQSYSFRRGTYPSTIFSLSFGPSMQLPDILVAASSSGSIHVFSLSFAINQRWELQTIMDYCWERIAEDDC